MTLVFFLSFFLIVCSSLPLFPFFSLIFVTIDGMGDPNWRVDGGKKKKRERREKGRKEGRFGHIFPEDHHQPPPELQIVRKLHVEVYFRF